MALPDRCEIKTRYTDAQSARLRKVARFHGQTVQAFQLAVMLRAIESSETEMDARTERRRTSATTRDESKSGGLFASRSLTPSRAPETHESPAPVIVNVGGANQHGSTIARLVKNVVDAEPYDRESRKHDALSVIKTLANDETEASSMIREFEAELAKRVPAPSTGGLRAIWDTVKNFGD